MQEQTASRRIVIYAILMVVGIMLAISITGFYRVRLIASDMDYIIQQQETQTALMNTMRQAAQERSLNLQSMLIIRDPFMVDELALAMSHNATRYITARQQLLSLTLNAQEQELLAEQHQQTSTTATIQTQIVELLREGEYEIAADQLLTSALPSQRKAIQQMDRFIELKREQNLTTLQITSRAIEQTYLLMLLLGLLGILLSIAIAMAVSRRINNEISQRQQREKELHRRELHERTIRDNIIDGVLTLSEEGLILSCNRACSTIFGYAQEAMQGQLVTMLIPSFIQQRTNDKLSLHLSRWEQRLSGQGHKFTGCRQNGEHFPAELDISRITLDGETIYIIVLRDISEKLEAENRLAKFQQELEERVEERTNELVQANDMLRHEIDERIHIQQELVHLANHDTLTQLPNRARFSEQINVAVHHARRHQRLIALLFLDLDGFKAINDNHGHGIGDQVLIEVGQRLRQVVRQEDMVARMGGDEFTVLLCEIKDTADATLVAQKLIDTINRPFVLGDHLCHLGTSIGIAVFPYNADDPDTLLRLADDAMYAAKESGKNSWCVSAFCALPAKPKQQQNG